MTDNQAQPALLVLEDGTIFWGQSVGATGETFGEMVFNTGMTGYQEVLTDPSYKGQIVVMTYPEIGIYGVNVEDVESEQIQVAGYAVHRAVDEPFNQRATASFTDYLAESEIVAIEGIDTRKLTRHLRTHGAMRGAISTEDLDPDHLLERVRQSPQMAGRNLAQAVTSDEIRDRTERPERAFHVALIHAGAKENIARDLMSHGIGVTIVPYDADPDIVMDLAPDGVMVSNGPGDPEPLNEMVELVRALIRARVPTVGICLGHQVMGLALGGETYKMRFGHRGVNHPVKDLESGRVLITTQNHGFAVDPTSLGIAWEPLDTAFEPSRPEMLAGKEPLDLSDPSLTMAELLPDEPLIGESPLGLGQVEITHLSLNDGTMEGLRLHDYPVFSVQYHPEAAPGPHDAKSFFDAFTALMEDHRA